jgi:hypothetical protein
VYSFTTIAWPRVQLDSDIESYPLQHLANFDGTDLPGMRSSAGGNQVNFGRCGHLMV